MIVRYKFGFLLFIFILLSQALFAQQQKLYEDRKYEPVVLKGQKLSSFYDVPIDEIYMYAYHANTNGWQLMPFQIDEMIVAPDPFNPDDSGLRYFLPDTANPAFDHNDELVFLVGDLGDQASKDNWINNAESLQYDRLELKISDPENLDHAAYGYLYRSSTITEEIPTPYDFHYYPNEDSVSTANYAVGLNHDNGMIEDIVIKPPFGNGVDLFDTQKLRFVGFMDFGGLITLESGRNNSQAANEKDNLYLYNPNDGNLFYRKYTQQPVVRLIREVRQTIKFNPVRFNELAFYLKTFFYPYSGQMAGGASLDPDSLKKEFDTEEDIYVELDLLRQSWDFNSAAQGMKFYNRYNNSVLIDGNPENVNTTVDTPIREWMLTSGEQGSFFSQVEFADSMWQSAELYYYDNKNGGQGDGTTIIGGDTGDSVSYGDQGVLLRNSAQDAVSFELGFTAYFLPKNLQQSDGEKYANIVSNPVKVSSAVVTDVTDDRNQVMPDQYKLFQNYPNPFNPSTEIKFSVPENAYVRINVFNILGQKIRTLTDKDYSPGTYSVVWNSRDDQGNRVYDGVYFYRLTTKDKILTRKMTLMQ